MSVAGTDRKDPTSKLGCMFHLLMGTLTTYLQKGVKSSIY